MEVILQNYYFIIIIMHYIFTPIKGKALFFWITVLRVGTWLEQYNHAPYLHPNLRNLRIYFSKADVSESLPLPHIPVFQVIHVILPRDSTSAELHTSSSGTLAHIQRQQLLYVLKKIYVGFTWLHVNKGTVNYSTCLYSLQVPCK